MKLSVNVGDRGEYFEVVSLNDNEGALALEPEIEYPIYSWEVYEYIASNFMDGKTILIPKYLEGDLNKDLIIISDNLSELERSKAIAIIKMRDYIVNTRLYNDNMMLIELYKFILLNNWFIDKGFIITEENRTDKYLEIINYSTELMNESPEKGEEVINKLDSYLEILDSITETEKYYHLYLDFKEKINEASTVEEVNNIYNTTKESLM